MSHILGDPEKVTEKPGPTIVPSNGVPLFQLPTELLIDIIAKINDDYLRDSNYKPDPLIALRL